jgi:predicted dehydrogenase
VRAYGDGEMIMPRLTDGDAYQRQAEAFARVICEGGSPTPDVRDRLAALRLIEATMTAVEESNGVTV